MSRSEYELGLIRTDRGLFLDKGNHSFNVMHPDFGAQGDGITDDTDAIKNAIVAAVATDAPGVVYLPPGTYSVTSDINVPENVVLCGSGVQGTTIKWTSGTITTAVITSNLLDEDAFSRGTGLRDMTVDVNGQALGLKLLGWNENCRIDDVTVKNSSGVGVHLGPAPGSRQTHQVQTNGLKIGMQAKATGQTALQLNLARRCVFRNTTIDIATDATAAIGFGIDLVTNANQNVFIGLHLENCDIPIRLGSTGNCGGNTFLGVDVNNPEQAPSSKSFGGETGTMCVQAFSNTHNYTILDIRDRYGFAFVLVDNQKGYSIPGLGSGSGITHIGPIIASRSTDNASYIMSPDIAVFPKEVRLPSYTNATRGAAGTAARIIFNTNDGQLNIDDGTNWTLPDGTTT